jgi:hypothetical protein
VPCSSSSALGDEGLRAPTEFERGPGAGLRQTEALGKIIGIDLVNADSVETLQQQQQQPAQSTQSTQPAQPAQQPAQPAQQPVTDDDPNEIDIENL